MNFEDMFKPYSPEIRGDLEDYLRGCERGCADNLFLGPKYFFVMKDKGLLLPNVSSVRVNQSPVPDIAYFVNDDYLLKSGGRGHHNMSLIGAKEGVYDPNEALKDQLWSISGLKIWD